MLPNWQEPGNGLPGRSLSRGSGAVLTQIVKCDRIEQPVFLGEAMTAIIIILTPDQIIAAADSKVVKWATGGGINPPSELGCKIRFTGETGFSITGLYSEPQSGFDPFGITQKVCSGNTSLSDKLRNLEDSIRGPFIAAINNICRWQSDTGKLILQVAVFGFDRGEPLIKRLILTPVISNSTVVDLGSQKATFPNAKTGPWYMLCLSNAGHIVETLQNATAEAPCGLLETANKAIQLAIEKFPDSVGPPIDIVSVTRSGRKWMQRKRECKD